eukprot:752665-Hanusia_phi.AAC.1
MNPEGTSRRVGSWQYRLTEEGRYRRAWRGELLLSGVFTVQNASYADLLACLLVPESLAAAPCSLAGASLPLRMLLMLLPLLTFSDMLLSNFCSALWPDALIPSPDVSPRFQCFYYSPRSLHCCII